MIYGRRRIDPNLVRTSRKKKWILDRNFQVNYATYLTLAVAGSSLLTLGAVLYFVQQNYDIFMALAFDTQPGLVQHLEREVTWLRLFTIAAFAVISLSTLFLTLRMTSHLVHPLVLLERHMKKLTQGYWSIPDLENSERDFSELLATYDYFYRSLKMMSQTELELLKKLHVDPANREAYAAWKTLLENHSKRLGVSLAPKAELKIISSENVVTLDEKRPPRRAS